MSDPATDYRARALDERRWARRGFLILALGFLMIAFNLLMLGGVIAGDVEWESPHWLAIGYIAGMNTSAVFMMSGAYRRSNRLARIADFLERERSGN